MKKYFKLFLFFIFALFTLSITAPVKCEDDNVDDWSKQLDVFYSDGLDKPVNAGEYKKTMDELQKLKDKAAKKKKLKKGEMPPASSTNEPIKIERNDILKITSPLYYDEKILPVGFYKISAEKMGAEYYINLIQGKTTIMKVKANKVSYMSFGKDKINFIETEIYQKKYFKIKYKNIDYALCAYLAILAAQ